MKRDKFCPIRNVALPTSATYMALLKWYFFYYEHDILDDIHLWFISIILVIFILGQHLASKCIFLIKPCKKVLILLPIYYNIQDMHLSILQRYGNIYFKFEDRWTTKRSLNMAARTMFEQAYFLQTQNKTVNTAMFEWS